VSKRSVIWHLFQKHSLVLWPTLPSKNLTSLHKFLEFEILSSEKHFCHKKNLSNFVSCRGLDPCIPNPTLTTCGWKKLRDLMWVLWCPQQSWWEKLYHITENEGPLFYLVRTPLSRGYTFKFRNTKTKPFHWRVDLNPRIFKIFASWMSVRNISGNYVLVPVKLNWTETFENHPSSLHLLISADKDLRTRVWSCSFDFIHCHW